MSGDLYQSTLRYGAAFEESSSDGVNPRPHWATLMQWLRDTGPEELGQRWARAARRIRENGMTYNIYGDPQGANRPWQIDIVPLVLPEAEWRFIEAGVVQRAQLLSLLLQDIYGPQQLLRQGQFPAAMLYANPAFLRPLVGVPVPPHSYLHMLAVDLARSPDGRWWVLADRTQAPSGSGYALENRTIVANLLPELFRASNVLRLAPFFRAQRDALTSLAGTDNPRIVLLTPGPHNETYFEHSYLAKYLGFTLVEGRDLTVRDRRVYLKTVEQLEQVDVILRRVDDSFCDPLELRSDSLLGVSGLVDAIVAGNVKVANALGSGVIESAAIMPFLPGLARQLLGEQLKIPSVATWWCGEPQALDWVLKNLDSVVVKPAFPTLGMEPVFGSELANGQKDEFKERLRTHPHEFVAQEQVALSTAPVWENGILDSRSVVLRTYVLNTGNGWMAIPGGLVRVAGAYGQVVSMQQGGHSKDTWVLSETPVDTFSLLKSPTEPVEIRRIPRVVPSSVADNTFWLGRNVERAENIARILRSMVPGVHRADPVAIPSLVRLHAGLRTFHSKIPISRRKSPTFPMLQKELLSMLTDSARADSLPGTLAEVARIGGNVRERLSADMMLLVGKLRLSMQPEPNQPDSPQVSPAAQLLDYQAALTRCLELLSAFSGLERENINRGPGWLFMSIGRRLERAIYLVRQLRLIVKPMSTDEWAFLERLLEVQDSSMTYRTRYYTTLHPLAVLDVLMADETNPRSLEFQLEHLGELYEKLPRHAPAELQTIHHATRSLRKFDLQALHYPATAAGTQISRKDARGLARLDAYLADLELALPQWSSNLSGRYFSHVHFQPVTVME
jgi:uncharacterized circularly permuted ATP-grasp superfamily protein/uncharacterized alpha-E superfamily protein